MPKFKVKDAIECIEKGRGFEKAIVLGIYTSNKGKTKGRRMYLLKIMNGTATIPVDMESNYRLSEKDPSLYD